MKSSSQKKYGLLLLYAIRTWTLHDTPKGAKAEYSIYDAHLTIQEALMYGS